MKDLGVRGITRNTDDERSLVLWFPVRPSDEALREVMARCGVDAVPLMLIREDDYQRLIALLPSGPRLVR